MSWLFSLFIGKQSLPWVKYRPEPTYLIKAVTKKLRPQKKHRRFKPFVTFL